MLGWQERGDLLYPIAGRRGDRCPQYYYLIKLSLCCFNLQSIWVRLIMNFGIMQTWVHVLSVWFTTLWHGKLLNIDETCHSSGLLEVYLWVRKSFVSSDLGTLLHFCLPSFNICKAVEERAMPGLLSFNQNGFFFPTEKEFS